MNFKELYKDKIKTPDPPEFYVGDRISPEALAAYIDKPNLKPESFTLSGRSERVGHYSLERQLWIVGKYEDGKAVFKFTLRNHSHQGECTENGIIDCRQYLFTDEGEYLLCESFSNEMLGFYDQMSLDGDSIMITM